MASAARPADPRARARAGRQSDIRTNHRDTNMFAKRDAYVMTEEEIADYEKSEQEQSQKRKKKPEQERY